MEESPIPEKIGNYLLKEKIGEGSYATVYKAENIYTKKFVAIKVIANSSLENEESKNRFIREISIVKQMDHPFISKLFEIINTKEYTYLIMEYAENGSILLFINANGRLPETQARRYFSQLLSGIEYLHNERHVAHRDLKAENVLLDKNMNIRLIDFGLSNVFSYDKPELHSSCGSPAYASPEMVKGLPYTKMADIWSAGVLLYAMVTGFLPFEDDNLSNLLQKIAFTEPNYPSFLSPQITDLLKKILTKSTDERLSIHKIKTHPWFSQTEYAHFLKLRFWTKEKWLAKGIDRDIVDTISSYGVNVQKLPNDLICGEYNEVTAIYLILRREQIMNQIDEMMKSLQNSGDPNANAKIREEPKTNEELKIQSKSNPSSPNFEIHQKYKFKSRKCDLSPVVPQRRSFQIPKQNLNFSPPSQDLASENTKIHFSGLDSDKEFEPASTLPPSSTNGRMRKNSYSPSFGKRLESTSPSPKTKSRIPIRRRKTTNQPNLDSIV